VLARAGKVLGHVQQVENTGGILGADHDIMNLSAERRDMLYEKADKERQMCLSCLPKGLLDSQL
jgi:hypothetical protein